MLSFLEEEGQSIEPSHYLPILPLCLVNGADGIGTGWSTHVPCYDPRALIANLKRMMRGECPEPLEPWYKGWTGSVEKAEGGKGWTVTTPFERDADEETGKLTELAITELPIGKWTRDYKTWLEESMVPGEKNKEVLVAELREHHAENRVHFALSLPNALSDASDEAIAKKFKLHGSIPTSNLVLFDAEGKIQKYDSELDILKEFFGLRQDLYVKRREYLLCRLDREHAILANKVKFIQGVISGALVITRVKRPVLLRSLEAFGLAKWSALAALMEAWAALGPGLKGKGAVAAADPERAEDAGPDEENKDGAEP